MFEDQIRMRGKVKLVLYRSDGTREYRCFRNLVVSAGKTFIASRMVGATAAVMSTMAVGTDSTAPAITQTALIAPVAGGRVAFDSAGSSGAVATYTATFGPGTGTGALQEAGIFNDPTAGTMLARVTYPVVNKGATDIMSITWTVTVT
jgi:hypothetical protein